MLVKLSVIGYTETESMKCETSGGGIRAISQGIDKRVRKTMDVAELAVRQTIKRTRQEQGLTQAELAKRLGVHRDTISRVETGKRALELGEFFDWAEALGITSDELFERINTSILEASAA